MSSRFKRDLHVNAATITCLQSTNFERTRQELVQAGYDVRHAELAHLESEREIFLAVAGASPGGEIYLSYHDDLNLDALADTLVDGLRDGIRVAVLLTGADRLIEDHLNQLFGVQEIFVEEYIQARRQGYTLQFHTYLFGDGPNFVDGFEEIPRRTHLSAPAPIRTAEEIETLRASRRAR